MFIRHHRALSALILGFILGLPAAQADLRKVDQTIYGMDCAPCAFGTQKGLSRLEGVTGVDVSLNNANAVIELAPGSPVSLQDIRRVVRNGGFKPVDAVVWAAGILEKQDDGFILATGPGRDHRLQASGQAQRALRRFAGAVLVQARVSADGDEPWAVIDVTQK